MNYHLKNFKARLKFYSRCHPYLTSSYQAIRQLHDKFRDYRGRKGCLQSAHIVRNEYLDKPEYSSLKINNIKLPAYVLI